MEDKNFKEILRSIMLQTVPSYANKIYYSMGFLSMTAFLILILSGIVMVFFGPNWWLTDSFGVYIRSIHLWATQAFILFIFLHLLVVFLTSGYRVSRKITWIFGSLMLIFALFEAEFGYGLRGDFSAQWRTLQASDLYNGSGLGMFINNLNYAQIYGIHIIIIPLLIISLLFFHYLLIRVKGISKPYKKDVEYKMVRANHTVLFIRGMVLTAAIVILAFVFKSPFILPTTIKDVATEDPNLMASTLIAELNHTSDTATYLDNIDPYKYDSAKVYIENPYEEYIKFTKETDVYFFYLSQGKDVQNKDIDLAQKYFKNKGSINPQTNLDNPLIPVISSLILMAQNGDYEKFLNESSVGLDKTYVTRFLSDTGVLEGKAQSLNITTDQYGTIREEKDILPPGAWWLFPVGFLDHTILANDPNQDRDGAQILGLTLLLLIAFPYIPYLNRIPEKLGIDKWIWKDKKK
jgi:ubiquinol-cytochrome c reductase cytochrome b subunit